MKAYLSRINFSLFLPAIIIASLGLVTLYTFDGENTFFWRQLMLLGAASGIFFLAAFPDYRFFRVGYSVLWTYIVVVTMLVLVPFLGFRALGAQMSFNLGIVSIQPSELAKLALILVLAKYFSMRHELIGAFRHIFVSGIYLGILFGLIVFQPDFGSAMILGAIWFGMILVVGVRPKHLAIVFSIAGVLFVLLWNFGLEEYQKDRIHSFLNPLADTLGTGYNANQSVIATGSGQVLGKGIGYGTQSKLNFLPEHETDFIFASFAEEWGFVGVLSLFSFFGWLLWSIVCAALRAQTNFEKLFGVGIAIFITTQFTTHVGMNIGVLPITGLPLPFMSFGGSHLFVEFLMLGMLSGMTAYTHTNIPVHEIE